MAFADRRCSKIHRIYAWSNHDRNVPKLAAKVHHDGRHGRYATRRHDARSRGFLREAGVVIGAKNQTLVFRTLGGGRRGSLDGGCWAGQQWRSVRLTGHGAVLQGCVNLFSMWLCLYQTGWPDSTTIFGQGALSQRRTPRALRPPKNMLPRRVDLPIHRPLQGWRDVERFPKFFSGGLAPAREGGRPGSHLPLRAKRFFRRLVRIARTCNGHSHGFPDRHDENAATPT